MLISVESKELTAVCDLAGVAARRRGSPLGERSAHLAEALGRRAGTDALVLGQGHLLPLSVGALDLGRDGHNLVVEQAGLLRALSTLEALGGVLVHLLPRDVEVAADILARPAHGLHAVGGLLALGNDGFVEGLLEAVAALGHALGAAGDADLDGAVGDGVGNVGSRLQARGAEAVHGVGAGRVGEAGGEGGGTSLVRGLAVRDLGCQISALSSSGTAL